MTHTTQEEPRVYGLYKESGNVDRSEAMSIVIVSFIAFLIVQLIISTRDD